MGWQSYHAEYYKNGTVDQKAECDAYFLEGLNRGYYEILKSVMVGREYYAAVRCLKSPKLTFNEQGKTIKVKDANGKLVYEDMPNQPVWAAVYLTSVDMSNYYNFSYKDMTEEMGPSYYNCPDSILKLLSPTLSESASAWREKCKESNEHKKRLSNLSFGDKISFVAQENTNSGIKIGDPVELECKCIWGRKVWVYKNQWKWKTTMIPKGFQVAKK